MIRTRDYPWMTDDQYRCAELIAAAFGGFHHVKTFKPASDGVAVNVHQNDLSTFDFSHLTELVVLAHDRCIRVAVVVTGMRLQIRAYPRKREGDSWDRHPTLEQAIAHIRSKHPAAVEA